MKRMKLEHLLIYAVITFLILLPLVIVYKVQQEQQLANKPVDVLRDWTLTVDTSRVYHPGDIITVNSKFVKLISTTGASERYIQCLKPGTNKWDGLVLANKTAATQPKTTVGSASFLLSLPALGNVPNTCRVYIAVRYNVNQYHPSFQEQQYSNSFSFAPLPTTQPGSTTVITDGNTSVDNPVNNIVPTTTTTPQTQTIIVEDNSDTDKETSPPTQSPPSLFQRIVNSITNIL